MCSWSLLKLSAMISHFISVGLIVFIIIFAHVTSSKNECNHRGEFARALTLSLLKLVLILFCFKLFDLVKVLVTG